MQTRLCFLSLETTDCKSNTSAYTPFIYDRRVLFFIITQQFSEFVQKHLSEGFKPLKKAIPVANELCGAFRRLLVYTSFAAKK